MYRTDDPAADFDRYDREQARDEERLPRCDYCGCVIHEHYWRIKGEIYCEECLDECFRHDAEDYDNREDDYEDDRDYED